MSNDEKTPGPGGDAKAGTPAFANVDEATAGLVPNPQWWIRWPLMPLRNDRERQEGGWPRHGYLRASGFEGREQGPFQVYEGNVWAPNLMTDPIIGEYETVEALMAAGWRVD